MASYSVDLNEISNSFNIEPADFPDEEYDNYAVENSDSPPPSESEPDPDPINDEDPADSAKYNEVPVSPVLNRHKKRESENIVSDRNVKKAKTAEAVKSKVSVNFG